MLYLKLHNFFVFVVMERKHTDENVTKRAPSARPLSIVEDVSRYSSAWRRTVFIDTTLSQWVRASVSVSESQTIVEGVGIFLVSI